MATDWVEAENLVAKILRNAGADCEECIIVNTKLPGKADILAKWSTGKRWRVQVKSTSIPDLKPAWPSKKNLGILKATASLNGEIPVVAWVYADNTVVFYSARNRQLLIP